jgi:hypothetical protein
MRVILLCVHGLTPASLGCYGNEQRPTPNFDRLAAQSVVFDQHFADVPSVVGARHALLTGRHAIPRMLSPIASTTSPYEFHALLRAGGIPSFVVSDNPGGFVDGWDGDFEDVESALDAVGDTNSGVLFLEESMLPPWEIADETAARIFENDDDEPIEVEPWRNPTNGYLWAADDADFHRLKLSFAAAVADWDQRFGMLHEVLTDRPWFQDAMFIAYSGRGQALGEHGICGDYRPWLYEELTHVPLVIRLPHAAQANRRVFQLTQTVDIPATVAAALGLTAPLDWHGQSLLPIAGGGTLRRDYVCFGLQIDAATESAIQTTEMKLVLPLQTPMSDPPREPMLFMKPDDRWEVNNVRQAFLPQAESLECTLRAYVEASSQPGPMTPPTLIEPVE